MNWSRAASTICSTAQFLGGLSSGPLGMSVTAAALLLSQVLGVSDYQATDTPAINDHDAPENDPQVDHVNSVELEQLIAMEESRLAHASDMAPVDGSAIAAVELHE
ncbi:hypothetical protein [Paraburkholderia rhizosphaerae]|uniref:Uncharacterized protein n=1 Tax=Paraburkholderia rhizosphaerae TaxID=480658 RepID=A0A4R8LE34_9BURK|nr:hypothetical protein [Paraburkholderia rhizosphaerae]TDY40548.1 hypothetical protein BX592_12461 [Paraburkholderia rhizosphaerae]